MYDIYLNIINNNVYFVISSSSAKDVYASTSYEIATLLGLETKTYNKVLIEKVIQHDKYYSEFLFNSNEDDITFCSEGNAAIVYIKRFKDAFEKELVLLELGGK